MKYTETKQCRDCGAVKTLGYFNRRKDGKRQDRCVKCPAKADPQRHAEALDERRTVTPAGFCPTEARKFQRMHQKYGIDYWKFHQMLEQQGGGCAICGATDDLVVDHDHSCCPGRKTCGDCVRGLLCGHCNTGLGRFFDSEERLASAQNYLRDSKA